ncbi:F-box only protein 33 isoform X2 [Schistocerca nitens]|uniref:F-box only protein 33 isoform X2 n=1 Tax=Schistocerca nitens TaxID=7011 RepID=UPI002118CB29|nr:F-box only protein 33 isoform X2 [Schistocerca nitens]
MAMEEGSWNHLPSVILLEVFTYLSQKERIRASSTCKQWRGTLFHSSFWPTVHFRLKTKDEDSVLRTRYQLKHFATKLRNATISFDAMDLICVQEAARIIQTLRKNESLRRLSLQPSHCRIEVPGRFAGDRITFIERHFMKPLQQLMQNCRSIEFLDLGCLEEICQHASKLTYILGQNHARSLHHLRLASIKDDPECYLLDELPPALFRPFQMLQVLSVDYDYLSDEMLPVISNLGLRQFIIHVHGVEEDHPGIPDSAWAEFANHNPSCEVHLILIHAYDAVEILDSTIFRPSMPLSFLKVFFCENVNYTALQRISLWYYNTLQSLWWIDSIGATSNSFCLVEPSVEPIAQPDPLVMMAWRCTKLKELVFLGYKYYEDDLIAIARLRGSGLQKFEIHAQDILRVSDVPDALEFEISRELKRTWAPRDDVTLPAVILNPILGDSDEYILQVLRDTETA